MLVTKIVLCCAALVGAFLALLIVGIVAGGTWLRGDEIAFVSYHEFNADIYIVDVDRGLTYNLTDNEAYDVDPAWSPDGQWVAFTSDRGGGRGIYLMDALGREVRRLTDSSGVYAQPRWSADGQRLIFLALNQAPNGIYSINADGSNFQRLDDPGNPTAGFTLDLAYDPGDISRSRSPDGSRIAFMTYRNQAWGIYISRDEMRQDAHLLVDVGRFTEAPAWSPDGRRMAYIAQRDGSTDLFMIDVDGGTPRRLTFSRAIDAAPAWRP